MATFVPKKASHIAALRAILDVDFLGSGYPGSPLFHQPTPDLNWLD